MTSPGVRGRAAERGPALLALGIPALAGIAYLVSFGAPTAYPAVNAAALAVAAVWMLLGRAPGTAKASRALTIALSALLFVPLVTGPELSGIARWIPLGPVTLHAGMLALPALAVLAARDGAYAAPILLVALFAAFLQPDAATGFAVTFAAVGLHHVNQDWKVGAVVIVGFFASIVMALRGELPAQPFVERVLVEAAGREPWLAGALLLALVAGFLLTVFAAPLPRSARFALGGALFGFAAMALMSNYPSVLIGYGASPILGFGLALGLQRKPPR